MTIGYLGQTCGAEKGRGLIVSPLLESRAMKLPRFQFTISRLLWATFWVGIGLTVWKLSRPFDLPHFLDDDPDNIRPRMLIAFYMVPIAGVAGSFWGRPIAAPSKAFVYWLVSCVMIVIIAFAGLF